MDSLEVQLRRCAWSWIAWTGALAVTCVLFAIIFATSLAPERLERPELPPLLFAAPPASKQPPAEHLLTPRPLMSPDLAEAFKFDPTKNGQQLDVPLEPLDASALGGNFKLFDPNQVRELAFGGDGSSNLALALNLERKFGVQKPEITNRIIIFDRNQVDEIPVWLYGPQPHPPNDFTRTDWKVLVLYSVSEKGVPETIYILDSSDPVLIPPVKAAVADWRFRPARKGGKPVRVWVQQPITFTPENKSPFQI